MKGNNKVNIGKFVKKIFRDKELFIAFIAVVIFFGTLSNRFLVGENISNVLRNASIGGILSLGLTFTMIGKGFDLSFGTAAGLFSIMGLMFIDRGTNLLAVFLLIIALGLLWGLMNGFLVVKVRIHPFVATLATWVIAKGLIYTITKGRTFYGDYPNSLSIIGRRNLGFLPFCALIFIVCAVISYILANRAKFGRYLYATGSNAEAARYAGIKIDKCRMIAYGLSGLSIGLAAIILGSKLCCGPIAAGDAYQMPVITSAFLGATVFKIGVVNMGGSILSIFLLSIIENGLAMLNAPFYFKYLVEGAIIIAAVSFISLKKKEEGPPIF